MSMTKKIFHKSTVSFFTALCIWMSCLSATGLAAPLTQDQLFDVTNNPNWVGSCGLTAADALRESDNTSYTSTVDTDKSAAPDEAYTYKSAGSIPKAGTKVKASIFGGAYTGGSFKPTNEKQNPSGGNNDDNGAGNSPTGIVGHAGYAELSINPGDKDFKSLGGLPEHTKLQITYNGKSVIAEKLDVGAGGDQHPKIDLWWETAKLLGFKNGIDDVTLHVVPNNTPTTPVDGSAKDTGEIDNSNSAAQQNSTECCEDVASSNSAVLAGNGNAEKIFNYFVGKGLKPFQAAGILGNIATESAGTFDPRIVQGGSKSDSPSSAGGGGYGIVQFTPGSKLNGIISAAKISGSPNELGTQLDAIWAQLEGKAGGFSEKQAGDDIKGTTDVADATKAWQGDSKVGGKYNGYERPASESGSINARIAAARGFLTKYGGNAPSSDSGDATGTSSDSSADPCCPPTNSTDTTSTDPSDNDGSPSDWKKMYTGANKSKVNSLAHGKINPSILAIHYTQGNTSGQDLLDYFTGTPDKLGIQFNVGKDGTIYQYYPLNNMQKTYHVGEANGKAIGIEITGNDVNDLLSNTKQFDAVVSLSKTLCDKYKIKCGDPKGDITGNGLSSAQGMLGHDELPTNDHNDPDAALNKEVSRTDSSKHPYMMKLREAMGFNPTPGQKGDTTTGASAADTGSAADTDVGSTVQCGSGSDAAAGDGTNKDHVGSGTNRALALEAVQYDTKANDNKYTYQMGGLHGALSQLEKFAKDGGQADCSGFVRYIIWKIYGNDVGSFVTQSVPSMSVFKKVDPGDVQAGDIGWRSEHVDFITENKGGGKLHQFGAHSEDTDLYGGDTTATSYEAFYRYVGPKTKDAQTQ